MKVIKKFLEGKKIDNTSSFNFLEDLPINYWDIVYDQTPKTSPNKSLPSKTPIMDALVRGWNNLKNTVVNTPVLPAVTGSTNLLGTNTYKSTIGDELKVAGAGAATIGTPAVLNYAYNYPITVATDLLYGYGGTELGGKIGNLIGQPIDQLTGNHYTSEGLGYLGNLVGGGFGLNAANNFRKRAIETVMRSGGYEVPAFDYIWKIFKKMPGKRKFDILKYIFTGNKTGPKGYYNSVATQHWNDETRYNYYAGLKGDDYIEGNDIIDSYLYGKPLDPMFATKLPKDSPNPYVDYIARNYPDKNIPIYSISAKPKLEFKEVGSAVNPSNWKGYDEFTDTNPFRAFEKVLDVGGHLEQKGLTETGVKAIRGADIWKFNPKDYILNWIKLNALKTGKVPYYIRIGLNEVDKAGTPVITMTPWLRELNDEEWINYWNSFPSFSPL